LRTFSAITSRRPFTLLGILLALLVIVAFVLVALNASTANLSPQQTVVVAGKDLQPRIPITAADLSTRSLPVPANYPKLYFGSTSRWLEWFPWSQSSRARSSL
jgi:Flp pilus assembly protein CpaB